VTGYEKINTIVDLDKFGQAAKDSDYLFTKMNIKTLVEAIAGVTYVNWNNLSADEKDVACRMLPEFVPYAKFILVFPTDAERSDIFDKDTDSARIARAERIETFRSDLNVHLQNGNLTTVMTDIFSANLFDNFVLGNTLLNDYVNSTGTYAGTGLRNKGFTPLTGETLTVLCNHLLEILDNGRSNSEH